MKRLNPRLLACLAGILVVSGCSTTRTLSDGNRKSHYDYADVDKHGTSPTTHEEIEEVNLFTLLDPDGKSKNHRDALSASGALRSWKDLSESEKYDLAFKAFYDSYDTDKAKLKQARNRLQDRMLAASARRCGRYKHYLRHDQTGKNFFLGLATTVAGGLGALVPGIRAANNLAGTAGLLSGVRAEYNQAYFSNLSVTLIVKGIEERQDEALDTIRRTGQDVDIEKYTVEAAVKDAISYDTLCSAVSGLEYAADSVRSQADPGLDTLNKTLIKANLTRFLLKQNEIDPTKWAETGYDKASGLMAMTARARGFGSGSAGDGVVSQETNLFDILATQMLHFTMSSTAAVVGLKAKYPDTWPKDPKEPAIAALSKAIEQNLDALAGKFRDELSKVCAAKEVPDKTRDLMNASIRLRVAQAANDPIETAAARGGRDAVAADAQRTVVKIRALNAIFTERLAVQVTWIAAMLKPGPVLAPSELPAITFAATDGIAEANKCTPVTAAASPAQPPVASPATKG